MAGDEEARGAPLPGPIAGLVEPRILSGCEAMEELREAGIFLGHPMGLSGCHLGLSL